MGDLYGVSENPGMGRRDNSSLPECFEWMERSSLLVAKQGERFSHIPFSVVLDSTMIFKDSLLSRALGLKCGFEPQFPLGNHPNTPNRRHALVFDVPIYRAVGERNEPRTFDVGALRRG